MSHFDKLVRLPEGFVTVATTKNSEYAAIAHQSKDIFGKYSPSHMGSAVPRRAQLRKLRCVQPSNLWVPGTWKLTRVQAFSSTPSWST